MSRVPPGGADFLIEEAIRAGHDQVPDIANYARVEPMAARDALNRLRRKCRVRRYGNTRHARYVLISRKRSRSLQR